MLELPCQLDVAEDVVKYFENYLVFAQFRLQSPKSSVIIQISLFAYPHYSKTKHQDMVEHVLKTIPLPIVLSLVVEPIPP